MKMPATVAELYNEEDQLDNLFFMNLMIHWICAPYSGVGRKDSQVLWDEDSTYCGGWEL